MICGCGKPDCAWCQIAKLRSERVIDDGKPIHWFTARAGSVLTEWSPHGFPEGVLEMHIMHPPRVHLFDGRTIENARETLPAALKAPPKP